MSDKPEVEALIAAGAAIGDSKTALADYAVVPAGYQLLDLERFKPTPYRKRAAVVLTNSASFIDYAKRHGSLSDCVIYAEVDHETSRLNLLAVIDDNGEDKPAWRQHTCEFAPRLSVEWKRWASMNGPAHTMGQADFATWLEDNLGDIAANTTPSGADMLAMAVNFEANADKRLSSTISLQSGGTRFNFVDDDDKETKSAMDIFSKFTLGIPVFDNADHSYSLAARLKYRARDGVVKFWYELVRPDKVFKEAATDEMTKVRDGTGFMMLLGQPGLKK